MSAFLLQCLGEEVLFIGRMADAEIYFVAYSLNVRHSVRSQLFEWTKMQVGVVGSPWTGSVSGLLQSAGQVLQPKPLYQLDLEPYELRVLVFSRLNSCRRSRVRLTQQTILSELDLSSGWQVSFWREQ